MFKFEVINENFQMTQYYKNKNKTKEKMTNFSETNMPYKALIFSIYKIIYKLKMIIYSNINNPHKQAIIREEIQVLDI